MFHSYDLVSFGLAISEIRKKCGLSQSKVKAISGINEDTLRKIKKDAVISAPYYIS